MPQVVSGGVGTNHNSVAGWFHDLDTFQDPDGWKPIGPGELSRSGTRLAVLRAGGTMGAGYEARGRFNSIQFYNVSSLGAPPQPTRMLRDSDGVEFATPSWSPGGDALAWATPAGVYSSPVGPNCEGFVERLVVPGGREPDWGPADPGAAAPAQPGKSQTQTPGPGPKGEAPAKLGRVTVKRGKVVIAVTRASKCRVSAVARRGKRIVARGKGSNGRVVLKFDQRVRGKVKLTVTVGATKLTKTVKVR